jgi:hypothetical protein
MTRTSLILSSQLLALLAFGALAFAQDASAPSTKQVAPSRSEVHELPVPGVGRQRFLYIAPAHPNATLIMFPGGAGKLGLRSDGAVGHGHNFVVRTRGSWVDRGFAVLIPDTIDGANLRGQRSSPGYLTVIDALVGFARAQTTAPIFLLGTSQGSIAAMNGAAHLPDGLISGVILTESVSRLGGSHETVFTASPSGVRVPVLIVANRDDRCNVAPPEDAPRIAAAMVHAKDVQIQRVSGGLTKSEKACGSLSQHGYYGIESSVMDIIARWILGVTKT